MTEVAVDQKDIVERLTDVERDRFKACEGLIHKGLGTFIEVGRALAEIRDYRLYRETHKTFEGYCRDVFDISKMRAYQQINGYETVMLLERKSKQLFTFSGSDQTDYLPPSQEEKTQNQIIPSNEGQTRPLTKLSPENQIKAWDLVLQQLNDGKKLTAALISKAVKEVCGEVAKKRVADTREKVESTQLVSKLFKTQYNVLLQIVFDERNNQWKSMKKTEVVKYLKELIKIVESDD